jgi:hypothetical protein
MNHELRSALKSWVSTVVGVLFVGGGSYQLLKLFYIGEMDFEVLIHGLVFLLLGFFLMGSRDEELSEMFFRVLDTFLGRTTRRAVGAAVRGRNRSERKFGTGNGNVVGTETGTESGNDSESEESGTERETQSGV